MTKVKVNFLAFAGLMMVASPAYAGGGAGAGAGLSMAVLQWACLLVLLSLGYKMAWKPILLGLEDREAKIKKSLEDAASIEKSLQDAQQQTKKLILEAEVEAKSIISKARETAQLLGKEIENKAKTEAQNQKDLALKEIEAAKLAAMQSLRNESAELAITLAGKLLGENLNSEKNRALTEKLIGKI